MSPVFSICPCFKLTALQRLGRFLDRPQFPWKRLVISFSIAQYVFESFLSLRQYRVLQLKKPPKSLEGEVSQEVFDKSQAYGRAKAELGLVTSLLGQVQSYAIIYYDVLPKLWTITGIWLSQYVPASYAGEIAHTLIFLFTFNIISMVLELPISYYSNFILEEKFGFNKQTIRLWVVDKIKGQALMIVLGAPLLSGFLAIIQKTGNSFFFYLWLFAIGVQVFAITIYPIAILPLFNKLSPLEEGPLKIGVESLAKRLSFPLKELHVIDGSKRSAHSNAYFYGLPWKKHIVIYDTLIEQSETEEVVAVLSHELGHWSLGHTTKIFAIAQVFSLGISQTIKILIYLLVPHILCLRLIFSFYQQSFSLPIIWLPQRVSHRDWLHIVFRYLGPYGYSGQAVNEHSKQKIRIPSRFVSAVKFFY